MYRIFSMKEKRKSQSQNRITSKLILTIHTKPLMNGVMKNQKRFSGNGALVSLIQIPVW